MLGLITKLFQIKRCHALLQAVALGESLPLHVVNVEAEHDWILNQVDRLGIEAAIELIQCLSLTTLVDIDKSCIFHLADASRTLALQVDYRFLFVIGPVNEVHTARVCRVAHVAERDLSVHRLVLSVVEPLKVSIDQYLRHSYQ